MIGIGGDKSTSKAFGGYIDDFRVYKKELLAADINSLFKDSLNLTSYGSGGGSYSNLTGATVGIPSNGLSLITAGNSGTTLKGGSGGSALSSGNFMTTITGTNLSVGLGGTGATSSFSAIDGLNYGDGGSGNNGIGKQGVVIIKYSSEGSKTLSLQSENVNISNLVINSNLIIGGTIYKSDGTAFTTNSSSSGTSLWSNSTVNQNNIYYTKGNVGIGIINPQSLLDINGNTNTTELLVKGTNISNVIDNKILISSNINYIYSSNNSSNNSNNTYIYTSNMYIYSSNNSNNLNTSIVNNSNFLINYNNLTNKPNLTSKQDVLTFSSPLLNTTNTISLTIDSSLIVTTGTLKVATPSQWTTSSTNIYYTAGNVGIGINNPGYKLDVSGNTNTTELLIKGTNVSNIIDNKIIVTSNILVNYNNLINKPTITSSQWTTSSTNIYYTAGNVGIGINNPSVLLHIYNNTSGDALKFTSSINTRVLSFGINNNDAFIYTDDTLKIGIGGIGGIRIYSTGCTYEASTNNSSYALTIANYKNDVNTKSTIQFVNSVSAFSISSYGSLYSDIKYANSTEFNNNATNGDLIFSTNNIQRLRISSNGFIGIGSESTVKSALDVIGDIRLSGSLLKSDGSAFSVGGGTSQWTTSGNDLYYTTGNVGIGTTNPLATLHLGSSLANTERRIHLTDATTTNTISRGLALYKATDQKSYLWNYENTDLIIGTSNTERLRITSNGNISIGTTNPYVNFLFHLNNTNSSNITGIYLSDVYSSNSNGCFIAKSINNDLLIGSFGKSDISFGTSNRETLRITSNGNIGIGTFNPNYKLHIEKGSVFIGDGTKTGTSWSGISSDHKLIFDNTLNGNTIPAGTNLCNKIVFYNETQTNTKLGFGFELDGLTYLSHLNHRFYTGYSGNCNLACSMTYNNYNFYGNVDGNVLLSLTNNGFGVNSIVLLQLINTSGALSIFLNSSNRTVDGGIKTATIRNDIGNLKLSSKIGEYIYLRSTENGGGVGIGIENPSYKLHVHNGGVFIGDIATTGVTNSSVINNYKLIFDNSFENSENGTNLCNKIVLYNKTDNNYKAGFGVENNALTYLSGLNHRFYTGSGGTCNLACQFKFNNFQFYGNQNAESSINVTNTNTGNTAYTVLRLFNNVSSLLITLNGGGNSSPNMGTIINNAGRLLIGSANYYTSIDMTDSYLHIVNKYDSSILFYTNNTIRVTIAGNGFVGIGVATPRCPLDVSSYANFDVGNSQIFAMGNSYLSVQNPGSSAITIIAQYGVWAGNLYYSSDIRIKKNIIDINDSSALDLILAIQPKIYNYIDNINKTNCNVYGFIAQQIKEVIPEAISIQSNIIPNIYNFGKIINSNTINTSYVISSNILINDKIRIITTEEGEKEYNITSINSSNSFNINTNLKGSNCFIYGTKIDDFHILDKSYIYTLNVCATQELHRIIQRQQEQINQMQISIQELQQRFSSNI
jgi:hypothetical protein